ncbi:hypothetical protein PHLCEN_2v5995 [Hermanssonia centrifuga]|uniref:Uncharacterized protein n=1 Tax=Hermanssonia centrifuga TaxID=98765 RepID=A0A2R6P0J8_9APHY|nr:hypothetical protein PHLCEN_2v5995 [Hermanssonia centrifuga]
MDAEAVVPQKRKTLSAELDLAPSEIEARFRQGAQTIDPQLTKNEYETGHVTCESCGEEISFRDEASGGFTVKHWDLHRQQCPTASQQISVNNPVLYTPESHGEPVAPQAKRRRAKRSEEERIEYLRSDPYVAQFEAYRVLCASCDKWIRLRPNSTYCSIPWDAHRKSCLAKKSKIHNAGEDRSTVFSNDHYVRKFDTERVLCKICETWIALGTDDNVLAVQMWMHHRSTCLQGRSPSTSASPVAHISSIPTIASVPPPSKHQLALASSSSLPTPPLATATHPPRSVFVPISPAPPKLSPTTFKDLTPTNFPPTQESRRRNAEQRAAVLKADPLISEVEPNRVFCSLCRKWVQLRQDSSYCAYPWMQHRSKCLNRREKRSHKEAELAEYRAQMDALQKEVQMDVDDSDELESEDGVESGSEEKRARRAERKLLKLKAKEEARAAQLKSMVERQAALSQRAAAVMSYSDGDEDAEGEDDMECDLDPPHLADLDTPSGRTTYDRSDDLTIAALVTYLNAAIPTDKHEDFDTTEVTKAATAIHERGDILFEGDVLRIPE